MSDHPIPLLDLKPEIQSIRTAIDIAMASIFDSGNFVLGNYGRAFEENVADYLGVKHAVGMNSGTDALIIGLRALGVEPGDEVITSPFTFFATAESISIIGATPVFVDIDPQTLNIAADQIEARITKRCKAIIPIHLFGLAAEMNPINAVAKKYNIKVLEDMAQAFGASYHNQKVGSFGDAAALSFFPTKNLGACGDGGMLVTNDDEVAKQARSLRVHAAGMDKYDNQAIGYNSRLDEIQAAILGIKLPYVDQWNQQRRDAVKHYHEALGSIDILECPYVPSHCDHVFHQYTLRVKHGKRDALQQHLQSLNIGCNVYYRTSIHQMPMYKQASAPCPHAEQASQEVLSLPIWPNIALDQLTRITRQITEYTTSLL